MITTDLAEDPQVIAGYIGISEDEVTDTLDPAKLENRFKLWTPQDLIDSNTPPVWTAKGLIIQPTYGMLAGAEKSLKSYIAQFIAVGAAAGVPILGQFQVPTPIPTLMMVGEGGRLPYTRRLERIARAYGVNLADLPLFSTFDVASTVSDQFRHSLVRNMKELWPGLVIIEPFYAFHGSASEGKMLHVEGEQLVWLGHTVNEYGADLIIGNHYNQTGTGSGLRRITGAGPAEWSDSWWIVEKDESRSDVSTGHFELSFDVGSRQWGGTSWDLVIDLGAFDDDTMDNEGDISWSISRTTGTVAARRNDQHSEIIRRVLAEPFKYTKSGLLDLIPGNAMNARKTLAKAVADGLVIVTPTPGPERGRMVIRDRYGPSQMLLSARRLTSTD
ncbi:MAG: AAA family ATPase [Acidimicrobiales bacterium]|jgi:hypothetical protein